MTDLVNRSIRAAAVATVLAVVAGCSGSPEPGSPSESPASNAPLTNEPNGFEGEFAVDWVRVPWPHDDVTPLHAVEAAAGRLWVLANTTPQVGDTFVTRTGRDRLWVSDDGEQWQEVDLDALGIPDDITGGAVMTGDDERVVVVFSDTNGVFGPDETQPQPWVLAGDGDDWQVFGPEQLGAWDVNNDGPGRFNIGSMLDVTLIGDTVVAAAEGSWPGSGRSVTLIVATLALDLNTGEAVLRADSSAPFGDFDLHTIRSLVSYDDAAYGFGETTTGSGIDLAVWRTTDGVTWTEQRPASDEIPDLVEVMDAVAGPPGIVVVAEAEGDSVALFSANGEEWSLIDLGSEWGADHVFWADDRFVVTGTARPDHPVEDFEATWFSSDGEEWTSVDRLAQVFFASDVISIPGALIAVHDDHFRASGALPPFSTFVR